LATVSTEYKQAFLERIAESAAEQGVSLYTALKAARSGRIAETQTGKVIIATAGNGQSVTFGTPLSGSEFTAVRAAELCQELINRLRAAATSTSTPTAALTDGSNDAALLTEMLALLEPINEVHSDFSELRCHA
jgi:hypothetical protein